MRYPSVDKHLLESKAGFTGTVKLADPLVGLKKSLNKHVFDDLDIK